MEHIFNFIETYCNIGPDKRCSAKGFFNKFNTYILTNNLSMISISTREIKLILNSKYKHKKFTSFNGYEGFEFKDTVENFNQIDPNMLEKAKKLKNSNSAVNRKSYERSLSEQLNFDIKDLHILRLHLPNNKIKYITDSKGLISIEATANSISHIVEDLKMQNKINEYREKSREQIRREELTNMLKVYQENLIIFSGEIKEIHQAILTEFKYSIEDYEGKIKSQYNHINKELWTNFCNLMTIQLPPTFSIDKKSLWSVYFKWYNNFEYSVISFVEKILEIIDGDLTKFPPIKCLAHKLRSCKNLKLILESN